MGLGFEIAQVARFAGRAGPAMSQPVVNERGTARRCRKRIGEIFPHPDASKTFMQEYERGRGFAIIGAARNSPYRDVLPEDIDHAATIFHHVIFERTGRHALTQILEPMSSGRPPPLANGRPSETIGKGSGYPKRHVHTALYRPGGFKRQNTAFTL